jgi:hypothetical protein
MQMTRVNPPKFMYSFPVDDPATSASGHIMMIKRFSQMMAEVILKNA